MKCENVHCRRKRRPRFDARSEAKPVAPHNMKCSAVNEGGSGRALRLLRYDSATGAFGPELQAGAVEEVAQHLLRLKNLASDFPGGATLFLIVRVDLTDGLGDFA